MPFIIFISNTCKISIYITLASRKAKKYFSIYDDYVVGDGIMVCVDGECSIALTIVLMVNVPLDLYSPRINKILVLYIMR
jgi:hypothetical protein